MKLLIVVVSKNRPKTFAKTTLKYISRSGYAYRIYVTRKQYPKYREAIKIAEEKYYLYVPAENIKRGGVRIPKEYDLVLFLPDNMQGFTDDKLLQFHKDVEGMRSAFNENYFLGTSGHASWGEAKMVNMFRNRIDGEATMV